MGRISNANAVRSEITKGKESVNRKGMADMGDMVI